MQIEAIASGLELREGIWYARNPSAVSYPEEYNDQYLPVEDNSFWYRHRNDCVLAALANFPPAGTFFDIGGGNGIVARAIQQTGVDTVLIEPSPTAVLNARKRGLRQIICAAFQDAGVKKGFMQAAGLFDVLEHVQDDIAFLRKVNEAMASGGLLYLAVPACPLLWNEEDEYEGHFRRYTLASLRKTLNRAGFSIAYSTYLFTALPAPMFFLRTLPYRLGRKRKTARQEAIGKEHAQPGGLAGKVLERILAWELARVKQQKRLPVGSSCFVVAKNKS